MTPSIPEDQQVREGGGVEEVFTEAEVRERVQSAAAVQAFRLGMPASFKGSIGDIRSALGDLLDHAFASPRGTPMPELPEEVETISVGQDALRRPVIGGGAFAEDYVRVADLPKIEEAVVERIREGLLNDDAIAKALQAGQDVNWDLHRDRLKDHPEGRPTNRDVVRKIIETALATLNERTTDGV